MSKPFQLLAVVALALGLVGCGGGGGPSSPGGGPSSPGGGPSSSGSGSSGSNHFSQGAGGVTVAVSHAHGKDPVFTVSKGGAAWTASPTGVNEHMTRGGYGASRVDDASAPTERIAAYTTMDEAASDGTADDDYLLFGYWNSLVGQRSMTPFYWGSMPYTGALPTAGNATYAGRAAGRFEGDRNSHHGHFTARVELTADFVAGTLSGRTSTIVAQAVSGNAPSGGFRPASWKVTFNPISLSGPSFTGGSTTSTAYASAGGWSGRFFGPSGNTPTGVAGVFDAMVTDAQIGTYHNGPEFDLNLVGSFGAACSSGC